ncbi:MAG: hypothetical protein KKH98_14170 [Spirochaetes bacterium]|nr:hypothetical protein [Spirochaetota bacterium]
MQKKIDINYLVDETGLQNSRNPYECRRCKIKKNHDQVEKEKWYYQIKEKEKNLIYLKKDGIGYVPLDKVDYLCNRHFKSLNKKEAEKFVQIGVPYFLTMIGKTGGIFSF